MARTRRPTILDVAEAAGVTDGTVSRALRGDARVREATRRRVQAAAERLGYRPDLAARALKQGTRGLVGVFCDSGSWMLHNGYFGRLLAGLADAAGAGGHRLLLYLPSVRPRDGNPIHDAVRLGGLGDLADGRVDAGVILGGRVPGAADLRALKRAGVPLVWLSPNEAVPGFSQLLSGAEERSVLAGRALARAGHRRVAFVGLYEESTFQAASVRGLLKGLGPGAAVFSRGMDHWDVTDPARLDARLDALLARSPTAFVCANADQAAVLRSLLERRGRRVPGDCGLLSFGPRASAEKGRDPQISLLEADLRQGGALAWTLVTEGLAGAKPKTLVLPWSEIPEGGTI